MPPARARMHAYLGALFIVLGPGVFWLGTIQVTNGTTVGKVSGGLAMLGGVLMLVGGVLVIVDFRRRRSADR